MFKKNQLIVLFAIAVLALTACTQPVDINENENSDEALLSKKGSGGTLVPLTDEEKAGLIFMREEEKVARDIYIQMYALWNLKVFDNIAHSEQSHMDAVKKQLDKYMVVDPIGSNGIGVFTNADLQILYNTLLEEGSQSAMDALEVGVLIEQTDINDLQLQISLTQKQDLIKMYTNLLRGSANHLAAFERNIIGCAVTNK